MDYCCEKLCTFDCRCIFLNGHFFYMDSAMMSYSNISSDSPSFI
mgnify:CR=1 FL=1